MPMARAKFTVISVNAGSVNMVPVTGASEENTKFFKGTPNGGITIHSLGDEAYKEFKVGSEYYVDFTEVGSSAPSNPPVNPTESNQNLSEEEQNKVNNPFANQENK